MIKMEEERKEFDEYKLTISSKEEMKIHIHDIHNYLRNNGAGYGMNALKLFTLFYGLAKIEYNGHFEKTELPDSCRFSEIKQRFDNDFQENVYVFINETVMEYIYNNSNVNKMLGFEIPYNIRSEVIRELVNKVSDLVELEEELGFQLAGKIYEYFIGRDRNAISELGAYFTDRHITDYIYNNVLDLELNEDGSVKTMIDPFGGSGGFTLSYIMHLQAEYPEIIWSEELNKVYHYDMNLDVVRYAMLEMYCLTGEFSNEEQLRTINSFSNDFFNQKFDYILTNPPYGGDKIVKTESVENMELIKSRCEEFLKDKYNIANLKYLTEDILDDLDMNKLRQYNFIVKKLKDIKKENDRKIVSLNNSAERFKIYADNNGINKLKCKDKESVSFLMMMDLLEEGGTAIGVLKEGLFFDKKYNELRQHCAENFNIEKIISIDSSQFENTATKTSIIKFSNTGRTEKIRFYELIVHKDERTEIKEDETGEFRITTIKDRINNITDEFIAEATFEDLKRNEFNFNYKLYNLQELIINNNYELVKLGSIAEFLHKSNRQASFGQEEGTYNFYTSSNKIKRCDTADYIEECIIIGTGGNSCIHYNNGDFSCSGDTLLLTYEQNTKFYYYLLKSLWEYLLDRMNGSTIKHVTKQILKEFKLPIPKDKQLINYWTDRINEPYDLLNDSKLELEELEQAIKNRIEQLLEENETEEVELDSIVKFLPKSNRQASFGKEEGIFNFYTSSNNIKRCDTADYNEECIIIGTGGNSCIHYNNGFFSCSGDTLLLIFKQNTKFYYYLLKSLWEYLLDRMNGSTIKHVTKQILKDFKLSVPKNEQLINQLNPLFDRGDELKNIISENERLYQEYLDELRNDIFNNI